MQHKIEQQIIQIFFAFLTNKKVNPKNRRKITPAIKSTNKYNLDLL
jgi:hypothetical protein